MCECGAPVFIKKTGECQSCYNRRYHTEHRRISAPKVVVTRIDLSLAVDSVESALRERDRTISAARSALYRAENSDVVRVAKADYRERNRDNIRDSDRAYRARNQEHIRARNSDYNKRPEVLERKRELWWSNPKRDEVLARKRARWHANAEANTANGGKA